MTAEQMVQYAYEEGFSAAAVGVFVFVEFIFFAKLIPGDIQRRRGKPLGQLSVYY